MRALVIGGTGPSGPHVVRGLLDLGHDVTLLNRGTRAVDHAVELETVVADPHFADSLRAALAGRHFDAVVVMYGRLRLMPEVLRDVTDRVVSVGCTAYDVPGGRTADEDAPRDLSNPLLVKVVAAEALMRQAHESGLFSHTHLRYPLLWGPGQLAPKDWSIARRALDGRRFVPVVDGGRTIESRCHVKNAAAAVVTVIRRGDHAAGRTYNVVDEENPDDATRTTDLCRELGRPDIELLNLPQSSAGPAGFWRVGRTLNEGQRDVVDTEHRVVDGGRIRRELGHRDVVPYDSAVRGLAQHYLETPLERGGLAEAKIGDPFDYAAEDAYAALLDQTRERAHTLAFDGIRFVHQYDHPSERGSRAAAG